MLGATLVTWENQHLRMDAVYHLAPPRARRRLNLLSTLAFLFTGVFVLVQSARVVDPDRWRPGVSAAIAGDTDASPGPPARAPRGRVGGMQRYDLRPAPGVVSAPTTEQDGPGSPVGPGRVDALSASIADCSLDSGRAET